MKLKLKSSNGVIFDVDAKVARKSITIKSMLDDLGIEEVETDSEAIPLPCVDSKTLKKVVQWCEHYKDVSENDGDKKDDIDGNEAQEMSEWDTEFFKMPQNEVYEIILAANYLEIKDLLSIGCKTVSKMICGKTPQQIRDHFGVNNDFTTAEESEIRKENEWVNEK